MADNLYAPPTPQELAELRQRKVEAPDLFGPPTEEELASIRPYKRTPQEPERGLLSRVGDAALQGMVKVGRAVDRYTGAPTRAAIGALQEDRAPLSAFAEPELAPTGKQIAEKAGLDGTTELSSALPGLYSDTGEEWTKLRRHGLLDPTAAGAAGLGVDIVADPTNVIPVGAIAKGAGKLVAGGAKAVGRAIPKVAKGLAIAGDVATGTKAASKTLNAVESVGKSIANVGDSLKGMVSTKIRPEFTKLASVATKHGIDPNILPSQIKFKGLLPRLEQAKAYGVGGEKILENNMTAFSQLDDAIDNVITKTGGAFDPVVAGEVIQDGYKKAVKNLFEENALRYSNLHELSPGLRLSDEAATSLEKAISGIEKRTKGLLARGTREQKLAARDIMQQLESVRASGGNVKQLSEQIANIGDIAYAPKSGFKLPVDQAAFRDLYSAMRDGITKTADDLSPELGKQLRTSNENISGFLKNLEPIQKALESKSVSPEALFKSLTADSKRLESLFKMVDPETAKSLKGALLSSLVKSSANDAAQISRTLNALKAQKTKLLKVFDAAELGELEELLELGMEMGPRLSQNVPQTGVTGLLRNLKERVPEALIDDQVMQYLKSGKANADEVAELVQGAAAPMGTKVPVQAAAMEIAPRGLLGQAKKIPQGLLEMQKNRKRVGGLLKGAQSVAPSQYEVEE
jgi:hypothetical protein